MYKISEFSKRTGLSIKAIRLYEKKGILTPEKITPKNNYRFYGEQSLLKATQLIFYKRLGFTLTEIKDLLTYSEQNFNFDMLTCLKERLKSITALECQLQNQKKILSETISSLEKKMVLSQEAKRCIMKNVKHVNILVTGIHDLKQTAENIGAVTGFDVLTEVTTSLQSEKQNVAYKNIANLTDLHQEFYPDVVIVNDIDSLNYERVNSILHLYNKVGPHMSTVFNADDKLSVKLAAEEKIRKGRIFYYSWRESLKDQIKNIGGSVFANNSLDIFGFNLQKDRVHFSEVNKLNRSVMSAIVGLLDIGLAKKELENLVMLNDSF